MSRGAALGVKRSSVNGRRTEAASSGLFVFLWIVVVVNIYREHKRRTLTGHAGRKTACRATIIVGRRKRKV